MEFPFNPKLCARLDSFTEKYASTPATLVVARCVFSQQQTEPGGTPLNLRHEALVGEALSPFEQAEDIGWLDGGFLIAFTKPPEAVRFSLQLQAGVRALAKETGQAVHEQISIHIAAPRPTEETASENPPHAHEPHLRISRWLAGLGQGSQIFLTSPAFEAARRALKKEEVKPFGSLSWMNHGPCRMPDEAIPLEVCEIREASDGPANPPANLETAKAEGAAAEPTVWGWRPAPGAVVPGTRYVLEEALPGSRYGEDWAGSEPKVKERRTLQFCFRADLARLLKEQEAVFESVKKKVGQNRNVLAIYGVSFAEPPFYIVSEFFEGKDLVSWAQGLGGLPGIPFDTRLELVAQAASGLQGAHEARILHRDLRPEHILVFGSGATPKDVQVKLANFGVGRIGLPEQQPEDGPSNETAAVPDDGTVVPSPADMYKAPEVLGGNELTPKSEVYALSVLLCQLILGNLSEGLTPERMREIVGVFKRDGLLGFFASDPQKRAEGAGRLAGEIRAVNKDRDSRPLGPIMTRRRVVQTVVMASLCVASVAALIYGFKYLRRSKALAAKTDKNKKPGDKPAEEKDSATAGSLLADEERGTSSAAGENEEPANAPKTRHRPASAVREEKKKGELKESAEGLFRFIVLPIAAVIVIGTLIQQLGPAVMKLLRKDKPDTPPS